MDEDETDFWTLANEELRKVIAAMAAVQQLNDAERAFVTHVSAFGICETIPDYPKWSQQLGRLRDRVVRTTRKPLLGQVASLATDLIWQWEYGAMKERGYLSAIELSSLAMKLHEPG